MFLIIGAGFRTLNPTDHQYEQLYGQSELPLLLGTIYPLAFWRSGGQVWIANDTIIAYAKMTSNCRKLGDKNFGGNIVLASQIKMKASSLVMAC